MATLAEVHAELGRADKVKAFVAVIDASGIRPTAADLRRWEARQWELVTKIARQENDVGYVYPSGTTRALIIEVFEQREAMFARRTRIKRGSKSSPVLRLVGEPEPVWKRQAEHARLRRASITPGRVS